MDPTYDRKQIEANGEWHIAWIISEMINDGAPLGWSKYIPHAKDAIKKAGQGPLPEELPGYAHPNQRFD